MEPDQRETGAGLARSVAILILSGLVLGATYNALGLAAPRPWGIAWIARPVVLESLDELLDPASRASPGDAYGYGISSDPLGAGLPLQAGPPAVTEDLPEIPVLGRPVQVQLDLVRRLVQAGAAFVVDSRERWEYEQGHLPGAVLIPYSEASDIARLTRLQTGGRPIVVYCGGGACETSIRLGSSLTEAGHDRVLVFMGGFPAWEAAGLPVERGNGGADHAH